MSDAYIDTICCNDFNIKLNYNDIVLVVGPNNCGKTQFMKDIYNNLEHKDVNKVIISDFNIKFISDYDTISKKLSKNMCGTHYCGWNFSTEYVTYRNDQERKDFGTIRGFFCHFLDTESRLTSMTEDVYCVDADEVYTHPNQIITYDNDLFRKFQEIFEDTFNKKISPDVTGKCIQFSVSDVDLSNLHLLETEEIRKYPKLKNQGDGVKSFSNIVISLLMRQQSILMIDEPESFLHPPQAHKMGQTIGRCSNDIQLFIATHNIEIIKGLLETAKERLKILHIERNGNQNTVSLLNNEDLNEIYNDYHAMFSNSLDSVFNEVTYICEGAADCEFYSFIRNSLNYKAGTYVNFIDGGASSGALSSLKLLKPFNLKIHVILDLDVILNQPTILKLKEVCDLSDQFINNCNMLIDGVKKKPNMSCQEFIRNVSEIIDFESMEPLKDREIEQIRSMVKLVNNNMVKKYGESIFSGSMKTIYHDVKSELLENNIHLVPCGELESFVDEFKHKHGPSWVQAVMKKYPDPNHNVYDAAKAFIKQTLD